MTKEQEKVIEILTKKVDSWKCKRPRNPIIFNGLIDEIDTENNAIETVLNMLKEKDKKIEKLRNNNKDLLRKLRNRIKEVKKLERKDYKSIVTKQGKTLEERAEQLKKKDKIIDLMTEQLVGLTIWNNKKEEPLILKSKKELKQYFKEIAEQSSSIN